ncbi:hypothetical protein V6N12_015642 [Hibiscus sabdariffa]|uniref:Uncharacterized protein n=1 Tax=Hibiscus sabdariffa TaxID=183260 RepID=A0ABR2DNQ7_9ROSI
MKEEYKSCYIVREMGGPKSQLWTERSSAWADQSGQDGTGEAGPMDHGGYTFRETPLFLNPTLPLLVLLLSIAASSFSG